MEIRDRVKKVLEETERRPSEIADYVGVNESTIYRWRAGTKKNFNASELQKLAELLKVDYEWLQYGSKSENTPRVNESSINYSIDELLKEERLRLGIEDIPDTELGRALEDILDDAVSLVLKLRRLTEKHRKDSESS